MVGPALPELSALCPLAHGTSAPGRQGPEPQPLPLGTPDVAVAFEAAGWSPSSWPPTWIFQRLEMPEITPHPPPPEGHLPGQPRPASVTSQDPDPRVCPNRGLGGGGPSWPPVGPRGLRSRGAPGGGERERTQTCRGAEAPPGRAEVESRGLGGARGGARGLEAGWEAGRASGSGPGGGAHTPYSPNQESQKQGKCFLSLGYSGFRWKPLNGQVECPILTARTPQTM